MVLLSIDFASLHTILESLYNEMMPLCEDMLGVAKGVAGLGALFYVALRVWQSMARAEPVDVYPLLRPFALGICILLFPTLVLGTMNSILSPIVQGTHRMLEGQTLDMQQYRAQKDRLEREAMMRNPETAYLVSDEEFDRQLDELGWSPGDAATRLGMYMEVGMYNLEKSIRDAFRSLLELLFAAASLLIDTVRTFFLVVLSVLGPIAFSISVWDGLQSTPGSGSQDIYRSTCGFLSATCSVACLPRYRCSCFRTILPNCREIPIIHWTIRTACTSFSC